MAAVETRLLYAAFPWVAPSVNLGKSIIDFMQPLERARIKRLCLTAGKGIENDKANC